MGSRTNRQELGETFHNSQQYGKQVVVQSSSVEEARGTVSQKILAWTLRLGAVGNGPEWKKIRIRASLQRCRQRRQFWTALAAGAARYGSAAKPAHSTCPRRHA